MTRPGIHQLGHGVRRVDLVGRKCLEGAPRIRKLLKRHTAPRTEGKATTSTSALLTQFAPRGVPEQLDFKQLHSVQFYSISVLYRFAISSAALTRFIPNFPKLPEKL
uniref:Uncharacterized protein n=1 Tax=Caenorhabditis japonica TaxID=281687 RepID=A0A8R1IRQ3_CAEJA